MKAGRIVACSAMRERFDMVTLLVLAGCFAASGHARAANLAANGDFSMGQTAWTVWTAFGSPLVTVVGADKSLSIQGVGVFRGGVYQQIRTGGAGMIVTVVGIWRTAQAGAGIRAEVLVINGSRLPVNGEDEIDGARDALRLYSNDAALGWSGVMPKTSPGGYQISFQSAGPTATVILSGGNNGAGAREVLFDNIEVRAVPRPFTLHAVQGGFTLRTLQINNGGSSLAQIEQHPLTRHIYGVGLNHRLYRINPATMTLIDTISVPQLSGNAQGLAFDPANGDVFVSSHNGNIVKGTYNAQTNSFSFALFLDLPEAQLGEEDHGVNALAVRGGLLYINSGSATKQGPEPDYGLNARILTYPLTGGGLPAVRTFARGVRNHFDIAFRADGKLFGVENGPNCHFGEELNLLEEGKHYGFPYLYGSDISGSETSSPNVPCSNPTPPPGMYEPAWGNYGPDARPGPGHDGYEDGGVYHSFQPHSGPDGLDFYEPSRMDPTAAKFPPEFFGRAFVARWGPALPTTPSGRDVLSLRLDDAHQGFVCNTFLYNLDRPIDVLAHYNGKLYVLGYGSPSPLYEFSYAPGPCNPDLAPPTIACPPDVFATPDPEYNMAYNVELGLPVTSDDCEVASVYHNAPTAYPLGETIVTWTVVDLAGNTSTCEQRVIVRHWVPLLSTF